MSRSDRGDPANRDGGRYAPYSSGGYTSPDRYPSWDRSNQSDDRGYSRGYAPSSYHYPATGEDRKFETGYPDATRTRSYADHRLSLAQAIPISETTTTARSTAADRRLATTSMATTGGAIARSANSIATTTNIARENQSRFASEFSAWRQNRQGQRQSLQTAKEHMEVLGSDGVARRHRRSHPWRPHPADQDRSRRRRASPLDPVVRGSSHGRRQGSPVQDRRRKPKQAWKDEEQKPGPVRRSIAMPAAAMIVAPPTSIGASPAPTDGPASRIPEAEARPGDRPGLLRGRRSRAMLRYRAVCGERHALRTIRHDDADGLDRSRCGRTALQPDAQHGVDERHHRDADAHRRRAVRRAPACDERRQPLHHRIHRETAPGTLRLRRAFPGQILPFKLGAGPVADLPQGDLPLRRTISRRSTSRSSSDWAPASSQARVSSSSG